MCFLLSLPFAVFFLLLFPVAKWKMGRGRAQAGFFFPPSPPLFPLLSFPEGARAAVCTPVIIHEQPFHLQSPCSSHLMNPSTGILKNIKKK